MKSVSSTIFTNAKRDMEKKGFVRPDMAVADYRMLDDSHADVLVAFTRSVPTVREMSRFVLARFEGKALPLLDTARCYDDIKCIGMVCIPPQISRPQEDSAHLMKVTASTFLDIKDQSEWSVRKNPSTGVSYLARSFVDDFEGIIKARKSRLSSGGMVTAATSFEHVATAGFLTANEDDYVKFYQNGIHTGTVRTVEPDGKTLKIQDDDGDLYVVDRTAVIVVVRKDPEETEKINDDMKSFYEHIFPKEFVDQMFARGPFV